MVTTRSQKIEACALQECTSSENSGSRSLIVKLQYGKAWARKREREHLVSSRVHQTTIGGRVVKSAGSKPKIILKFRAPVKPKGVEEYTVIRNPRRRFGGSLKVKLLNIDYSKLPQYIRDQDRKIIAQQKRLVDFKGRYFPPRLRTFNNRYQFKFDHNPFQHLGFQGPSVAEQWKVYELMKKDLKDNFNKECFLDQPDASTNELQDGPMHMSEDLSIDNLVKVILSISTENSLAIRQHAQLCSKFTYTVDDKEIKGIIPNYHKMRVCSAEELVRALNIAGHHNLRQKAFHSILNEVYEQNLKRLAPGEMVPDGNEPGSHDFVPGMLSMEYLKGENLTKQEQFDLLVKFDQIAVKTGCCLLAFNLKIPVFVVDTHVHQMTRSLQWIPEDCYDADKACMFLDNIMPAELKFGLHQAFWHHRICCARCAPRANPKSKGYQERVCPLEQLINRDLPPMAKGGGLKDDKKAEERKLKLKNKKMALLKKKRKVPGSIAFLNMHYKMAEDRGYALRKVIIDDDFGDGSRQNQDKTANYYWAFKEHTLAKDIVKLEDALKGKDISMKEYEARFVKKIRKVTTRTIKEEIVEETTEDFVLKDYIEKAGIDLDTDSDLTDLELSDNDGDDMEDLKEEDFDIEAKIEDVE